MDRALFALCALMLNAAFAGPRRLYEAAGIMRMMRAPIKVLRDVERRLNREHRSLQERETRGFILVAVAVGGSFMLGWLLSLFFTHLRFLEPMLIACLLPVRPTWDTASGIRKYMQSGNLSAAKRLFEGTPWRHHPLLDEVGVARAAIELIAIQFSEKILAPILWYLFLGLPGFFMTLTITLMRDHMSQGVENGFGKTTWWLFNLLQYIPSRLCGILWMLAALFLPTSKWQTMSQTFFAAAFSLPPRPFVLLMASQAVSVSLGGPSSIYMHGWVGSGARVTGVDIHRALYLFALMNLFLFVVLGLSALR